MSTRYTFARQPRTGQWMVAQHDKEGRVVRRYLVHPGRANHAEALYRRPVIRVETGNSRRPWAKKTWRWVEPAGPTGARIYGALVAAHPEITKET